MRIKISTELFISYFYNVYTLCNFNMKNKVYNVENYNCFNYSLDKRRYAEPYFKKVYLICG